MPIYGGIEAGGTKFNCIIGDQNGQILAERRIPTTMPEETMARVIRFFEESPIAPIEAVGIGSFGPVDLDHNSPTYGFITTTPKPGWQNVDIAGQIARALTTRVVFETDVNAAAYGEWILGAARGLDVFTYITIGTGIGGGIMVNGKPIHGLVHPEIGHFLLRHDWQVDPFQGNCPYHGDCFEGLCSGPAMRRRWGISAENLPEGHAGWSLEAEYIAQTLAILVCAVSPQTIVLGGGVMQHTTLFPLIRQMLPLVLKGYIRSPRILEQIDQYVVPPELGSRSGVLGALALASQN